MALGGRGFVGALRGEVARIRAVMTRAGISEAELARRAGVSQPHVHNVLAGVRGLTPRVADLLNRALGSASE